MQTAEIDSLEAKSRLMKARPRLGQCYIPHANTIWLPSGRTGDSGVKQRSLARKQLVESRTLRHGTLLGVDIIGSQVDRDWDRASFFSARYSF